MPRNAIAAASAKLDAVIAEQYAYPRGVLGKTRALHPSELLSYTPPDLIERAAEARGELYGLLYKANADKIERARNSRRIPDRDQVKALHEQTVAKYRHYRSLADLGTEFVPASEIAKAFADAEITYQLRQAALDKNGAETWLDCRKPKRRSVPITDGYVKTRKYKMIDGERIGVVRFVEGAEQ